MTLAREIVRWLAHREFAPFCVPAMGSHGGGSASGQVEILKALGITEESLGCPLVSSVETEELCVTASGYSLHFDKVARAADACLLLNRIKPHTRFCGTIESGLCKMLTVGFGNERGARAYHAAFDAHGFSQVIEESVPLLIQHVPVIGGLALIEDEDGGLAAIEGVRSDEFLTREPELLQRARRHVPRLPFTKLDLLLVDEMGKDISGTGMDTLVIGRKPGTPHGPQVGLLAVRDLSAGTQGNAMGIGHADFVTERLARAIDWDKTRTNARTSRNLAAARLRAQVVPGDREMLEEALTRHVAAGTGPVRQLAWIRNTKCLSEFAISESLIDTQEIRTEYAQVDGPFEFAFDDTGALTNSPFRAGSL